MEEKNPRKIFVSFSSKSLKGFSAVMKFSPSQMFLKGKRREGLFCAVYLRYAKSKQKQFKTFSFLFASFSK